MTGVPAGKGELGYVDNAMDVPDVMEETVNVPRAPILTLKGVALEILDVGELSVSVVPAVVRFPVTDEFEMRVPVGIVEGHVERVIEDVVFEETL